MTKVARFFSDVPKVRENEMLFVPADNRIEEIGPWSNHRQKPDWWMRQKKGSGSIRTCHGTSDFISLGVTLPMWTNVSVRVSNDGNSFDVRCDEMATMGSSRNIVSRTEGFPASSTDECPFSSMRKVNGQYPKLVTPWLVKTAPGWSTLVLPTILEPFPEYSVMPGVVHTDYYHTINIVLIVNTDKQFTIPIGRPMYQLVPFKRSNGRTEVVMGNETMYRFLEGRGSGENYILNRDRKKSYRREQHKADAALEGR